MKTLYESLLEGILNIDTDNTQKATEKNQEFTNAFCEIFYKYLGDYIGDLTQNVRDISLGMWLKYGCKDAVRVDLAKEQFEQHPRVINRDIYDACVKMAKELDILFDIPKTTAIKQSSMAMDFIFKTYKFQETCNISVLPIRFIKGVYKPFKAPFLFIPKIIVEILQNYKP